MSELPKPTASARIGARTILLVEDNLHNRRIFQGVLVHAGFAVVEAEDGGRALELAASARPDLILMDLSIPVVDGWECTRRLKAEPGTRGIPIIALTAHAMRGDEDRARAAGCDGYLSKPISPKRVVEEVKRVLSLT
jgi:two-component system cell cycle response regulator DivK